MELHDVTIIGGGPAGLYAAFYCGLREMKVNIIEAQPYFGGKLQLYPDKVIWDVGAQPPTLACKLIDQIVRQGLTFNPTVSLNERITKIEKQEDHFIAHSDNGTHHSKAIILAIGGGIFSPQRLEIFENHLTNVHYTLKSPTFFRGKNIVISGKGSSVFDWALALAEFAKEITIVTSADKKKIPAATYEELTGNGIAVLDNSSIHELEVHSNDRVLSLLCKDLHTKEMKKLPTDEVLVNLGYNRDFTLLSNSQLPIQTVENNYIAGQPNGSTSVPGLFAIGDIIQHDAKLNMIMGAFLDAANAVNMVKQYIDPTARKTAMVSTHNTVFKDLNKGIRKTLG